MNANVTPPLPPLPPPRGRRGCAAVVWLLVAAAGVACAVKVGRDAMRRAAPTPNDLVSDAFWDRLRMQPYPSWLSGR